MIEVRLWDHDYTCPLFDTLKPISITPPRPNSSPPSSVELLSGTRLTLAARLVCDARRPDDDGAHRRHAGAESTRRARVQPRSKRPPLGPAQAGAGSMILSK